VNSLDGTLARIHPRGIANELEDMIDNPLHPLIGNDIA